MRSHGWQSGPTDGGNSRPPRSHALRGNARPRSSASPRPALTPSQRSCGRTRREAEHRDEASRWTQMGGRGSRRADLAFHLPLATPRIVLVVVLDSPLFSPSLGEPFLRRTGSPRPPPKTFGLVVPCGRNRAGRWERGGFRSPIRNPNRRPAFATACGGLRSDKALPCRPAPSSHKPAACGYADRSDEAPALSRGRAGHPQGGSLVATSGAPRRGPTGCSTRKPPGLICRQQRGILTEPADPSARPAPPSPVEGLPR